MRNTASEIKDMTLPISRPDSGIARYRSSNVDILSVEKQMLKANDRL